MLFRSFFIFILFVIPAAQGFAAPALKIHQEGIWRAMIQQWVTLKLTSSNVNDAAPERDSRPFTLASPHLRIDLTIYDLIDQVDALISEQFSQTDYSSQLKNSLTNADGTVDQLSHFDRWYALLNQLAERDARLKSELDDEIYVQEYDERGVALKDNIRMLELGKIHRIDRYNRIALNPEGTGLLKALGTIHPLTVTSAISLSNRNISKVEKAYLEQYHQEIDQIESSEQALANAETHSRIEKLDANRIFNAIENLPEKQEWLSKVDRRMEPKLPRLKNGRPVLVPSFILRHEKKMIAILKDLTWERQFSTEDDETILELRRWLKKHRQGSRDSVKETLDQFNSDHQTQLALPWLNRRGLPHRSEVIENFTTLEAIYEGREPWQEEIDTVLLNRRGKRVMIGYSRIGGATRKAGEIIKNAMKAENLAGLAAGTGTLFLTSGNIPLALTARSVAHDIYSNRKYDRSAKHLLTEIPLDLLQGALTQTGFQAGKFFNLLGLGAGYGFTQGVMTKQDPFKSAAVGAAMEGAIGMMPVKFRNPMISGLTRDALAKNAAIEFFTTTAKATLRGGIVAILDKQDVVQGMTKGAIYGAGVTTLKLVILGVRYDPLSGHDPQDTQDVINHENDYDNTMGAPGGNYQITTDTLRDTPYRTGGLLPKIIQASITLPGNVSMLGDHTRLIEIATHEAHHLSQQEQLGLIQFYVDYLWQSLTVPYEQLTFEISPY